MEKKFITQDDVLGFLEDWMNIPAETRIIEQSLTISNNPDGTIELGLYNGAKLLHRLTVIPDEVSLTAKAAMKYLMDEGGSDE